MHTQNASVWLVHPFRQKFKWKLYSILFFQNKSQDYCSGRCVGGNYDSAPASDAALILIIG